LATCSAKAVSLTMDGVGQACRSCLVADASGAPVLRGQGLDRPTGHGKAGAGVEEISTRLSVTCGTNVARTMMRESPKKFSENAEGWPAL
jgi:hypothetical protein